MVGFGLLTGFVDNIYFLRNTLRFFPFIIFCSRKIASFLTGFHVNTLPQVQCTEWSSCKAPLKSEAALHDSGGEPGETSLFIWLHILVAARVRRGGKRDVDRAWRERAKERELWAQWPIYSVDLYSVRDTVSRRTVRTCSSPHWPWIRSGRPPRVRLGLGNTEEAFCMIWPFRWDYVRSKRSWALYLETEEL